MPSPTWDPANLSNFLLSNGNLDGQGQLGSPPVGGPGSEVCATLAITSSDKVHFELGIIAESFRFAVGVGKTTRALGATGLGTGDNNSLAYYSTYGHAYKNNVDLGAVTGGTFTTGDTIPIEIDGPNALIYFAKGTSAYSSFSVAGLFPLYPTVYMERVDTVRLIVTAGSFVKAATSGFSAYDSLTAAVSPVFASPARSVFPNILR